MAVTRIPDPCLGKQPPETHDRLDLSLAEIDLAVRTVNGLEEERHLDRLRSPELPARTIAGDSQLRGEVAGDGLRGTGEDRLLPGVKATWGESNCATPAAIRFVRRLRGRRLRLRAASRN